ncbi:MAG: 50S ribosomal protein L24 [Thermoanaerobaculia bacterium]
MYGSSSRKEAPERKKVHLRKNDEVVVTTGKDRGKRGKVLHVDTMKGTAIVERVNFNKKHTKKNPGKNVQGGILEREAPLKTSNLKVVCPACSEPTRIGARSSEDGNVRICRKCGADLNR